MKQELGINLLVYKEKLDAGVMQSSLLKEIKEQGISLAEVAGNIFRMKKN